jgi:hypothetical protein
LPFVRGQIFGVCGSGGSLLDAFQLLQHFAVLGDPVA